MSTEELPPRESMEFDVVIVGAGPSGLAAAIRLKQINADLNVVVVEKGSEVGAHILSGAVIDPAGLDKLIPDWREDSDCPLKTQVKDDRFYWMTAGGAIKLPNFIMPPLMDNHHCYIGSLGNVCRWLARKAEALGVEIYPGFAAAEVLYDEQGAVKGIATGDMGIGRGRQAEGLLYPWHGIARQVHAVRGRRARQPDQAADREIRAGHQQRAGEVRHRAQGSLADRSRQAPEGHDPAFVRLAARTEDRRWLVPLSLRRQPRCRRLRRASQLRRSVSVAVRRVPAFQDPSRRSAPPSKAPSGSLMARAPSPRAAISRCRSSASPAAR